MNEGYKPIFDAASIEAEGLEFDDVFPRFHEYHNLFHFIVSPQGQTTPDYGSLEFAKQINLEVAQQLIDKGPSRVGSGSDTLDGVESRHILLATFLFDTLGPDWGNVVEIGGGYGNFLRLASGIASFEEWAIIDTPYILELQYWFLKETDTKLSGEVFFIPPYDRRTQGVLKPNLVIGTHSLSEFSWNDFADYFGLISKAEWFFYAAHSDKPDFKLLERKMALIQTVFSPYASKPYEGGASTMYLFRNVYK